MIPTKVSDLENDAQYITADALSGLGGGDMLKATYDTDGDGVVDNAEKLGGIAASEYAKKTDIPSLDGLATETYANNKVSTHNTSESAHNDIRLLVSGLTSRLNALANSSDETLDQMSEIVEYIKDNRDLIEGITTNKVNVSDIINNLETNVANKPLSAAQGVALKNLIDAIEIPTVNDATLTIKQNGTVVGTFTANQDTDKTIELTDTDTHAVTSVAGKTGAVTLSKSDVGLGNVDNTADKDKSVNHATSADTATTATYANNVTWSSSPVAGGITPIGASLSSEHSANRIAFLNPNAIAIESSDDGGSTWTDAGHTDAAKVSLVTTSAGIAVGSATPVTTNHRTRITLTAQDGTNSYVYTSPKKLFINVSTAGHGMNVLIETKTGVSGASWSTVGTYRVSGWSGWNDIPLLFSTFGGLASQTTNVWQIRLTFINTSVNSSYATTRSGVLGLRLFGDNCWTATSAMGNTGHIYSYDYQQNVTFPGSIYSPKAVYGNPFYGDLKGNADTATSASQVYVNRSNSNGYYPVLLTNIKDGITPQTDSIYASYNNTVTMNPSTGALKATNFEGNATTATTAQALGGGGITTTYNSSTDTVTFS